jgi:phosphate transport system substrate-binding protein
MKSAFILYVMMAAAPVAGFAQGTASAPLSGKLLITGSSTMGPMIEELGQRFRKRHPGVTITVEIGGSARGTADVLAGKADIGMASRELNPQEQALFAIPIARDGLAFVVHKDNPVRGLTRAQALDVFTGKITHWKALGGNDARIEVVTRRAGYSSNEIFAHYYGIAPEALKAAHVMGGNPEVQRFVVANRNAVALLSTGVVDRAVTKDGYMVKALAFDGAAPGLDSVRDGSWPLARPLLLLTRRVPAGAAKAFIEFALSPEARDVIVERNFVPYLN